MQRDRILWSAIVALVMFGSASCKPIAREEPASEEQYAISRLVRMFVHLVTRGDYVSARSIFDVKLLRHHSPREAHHLIRNLVTSGDDAFVPNFFASWVQESTGIAQATLYDISASKSPEEVEGLLKKLSEQLAKVRIDFIKQREAITAVTVEDGMYKLTKVIDALDASRQGKFGKYLDFDKWAKDFQRNLDKAFYRDTGLNDKANFLLNDRVKQAWLALEAKFAPLPAN